MNETQVLLNFFYRIMWTEFSNKNTLTADEIIKLIGEVGLNTLLHAGRITYIGVDDGEHGYIFDKSYLGGN